MYDLIIKNGRIVDGTGQPAFAGDVAIKDGKIAAVGKVNGDAKQHIDAKGYLVTPGWVDTHTHFDGQASWDSQLLPAPLHGTTTVLMGNCGVGFAPCKPDEHDMLIRLMESVEDIPGTALTEGLTWEWETFPEYLDALDKKPRAIDIATQVPHCALRVYVMGERGVNNEKATAEDIKKMSQLVAEGLDAGALGVSTSQTKFHVTDVGDVVPGTYADQEELVALGDSLKGRDHASYQLITDFEDWQKEMEWMKKLSIDTGRPVNYSMVFKGKEGDYERMLAQLDYAKEARKEGAQLMAHVSSRPIMMLLSIEGTYHPFLAHETFKELLELSVEERLEKLRDPEVKKKILSEKLSEESQEFANIFSKFESSFPLSDPPNYEPTAEDSVAAIAKRKGCDPLEVVYDTFMADGGKGVIYYPMYGYENYNLDRQVHLMQDDNAVSSLADSGAHCGLLADVSIPTYMLTYMVRDRPRGQRFDLEWAVMQQTMRTARVMGLKDRGTIEPGMKADINIIDFDRLQISVPEIIYDLPAGGRRMMQTAEGYVATLVSGEVIAENGKMTDRLPGKLIRGGQAA